MPAVAIVCALIDQLHYVHPPAVLSVHDRQRTHGRRQQQRDGESLSAFCDVRRSETTKRAAEELQPSQPHRTVISLSRPAAGGPLTTKRYFPLSSVLLIPLRVNTEIHVLN